MELKITSPSFENGGHIPKKHTGFGEDVSPAFCLENIDENAASAAIIMDDLDVPFTKEYTHWVIWNLPAGNVPENIPYGAEVASLGAVQGAAYGKNRYRGPKQPPFIHAVHRYLFRIYILDARTELGANAGKDELLSAMKGHILQTAEISGLYKRGE